MDRPRARTYTLSTSSSRLPVSTRELRKNNTTSFLQKTAEAARCRRGGGASRGRRSAERHGRTKPVQQGPIFVLGRGSMRHVWQGRIIVSFLLATAAAAPLPPRDR